MVVCLTPNILLFTAALLTSAGFAISAKRCPDCGTNPIPYPLSTAANCGDQWYKISCSNGSLIFNTLNNAYPITSISPETQTLVIRPASFIDSGKTCVMADLPSGGIHLDNALPFTIASNNTILLFNCTEDSLDSPLNCSSNSLCHTYLNYSREAHETCRGSPHCCMFQAGGYISEYRIWISPQMCRAYRSFVNLDESLPVSEWPEPGLELGWASPREPVCRSHRDCDANSTCGPDGSSGVLRCFCNSGSLWDPIAGCCSQDALCEDSHGCGGSNRIALIVGLTTGLGAALLLAITGMLLYIRRWRNKEAKLRLAREREEMLNANGSRTAKIFTGKEIKKATNNFSRDRLLGAGGYGEVYKAILEDGTMVAVKCAKLGNTKGIDQVLNEVRILAQVNHKSLVHLLGCCVELEQPLLIYEYIPNGTLFEHLRCRNQCMLTWKDRLNIAQGTAEGLAYLHFSAIPPIYHRDVKSSNILLDQKLNAKVSDFGLSRLAQTDLTHISTCAQGTLGYLDPEYYRNYQLTDKSDVYSFGVVLLELLTSQKAIDFNRPSDDVNLVVYVQRMVVEERLMDVIDPGLKEQASSVELETMKALGFLAMGCLEERRQNRPSMKEVAEEIEYIISIATAKRGEAVRLAPA